VRVFSRIERRLGVRLPSARCWKPRPSSARPSDRAERSRSPLAIAGSDPEGRSGSPLFCLHGNDGDVLFYRELASRLGDDQPVYGLQSPLLGAAPAERTLEQLARSYAEEIRAVEPHGPYCLAGFCLGAYLAFEIACALQHQGEELASWR